MVQKGNLTEMDENKEAVDDGTKREVENEKPVVVINEGTRKEVLEESVKAEEDTTAAPPSGKEREQCSDKGVMEGPKQEEDKSVSEK